MQENSNVLTLKNQYLAAKKQGPKEVAKLLEQHKDNPTLLVEAIAEIRLDFISDKVYIPEGEKKEFTRLADVYVESYQDFLEYVRQLQEKPTAILDDDDKEFLSSYNDHIAISYLLHNATPEQKEKLQPILTKAIAKREKILAKYLANAGIPLAEENKELEKINVKNTSLTIQNTQQQQRLYQRLVNNSHAKEDPSLMQALQSGNIYLVNYLIQSGVLSNEGHMEFGIITHAFNSQTPTEQLKSIALAISSGETDLANNSESMKQIRELLSNGANPNTVYLRDTDEKQYSFLSWALQNKQYELAYELVKNDANLLQSSKDDSAKLVEEINPSLDKDVLNNLLRLSATNDSQGSNKAEIKLLMELGAKLNAKPLGQDTMPGRKNTAEEILANKTSQRMGSIYTRNTVTGKSQVNNSSPRAKADDSELAGSNDFLDFDLDDESSTDTPTRNILMKKNSALLSARSKVTTSDTELPATNPSSESQTKESHTEIPDSAEEKTEAKTELSYPEKLLAKLNEIAEDLATVPESFSSFSITEFLSNASKGVGSSMYSFFSSGSENQPDTQFGVDGKYSGNNDDTPKGP